MTIEVVINYLIGSWLIGFMTGLLLRVILKFYVEWMT